MHTTLQRLGKYRLQERVGSSGIAEVWKAFSPQLRRYVAIKILHADLKNDPRFITRFEREAKAIASLHHPNIVQTHDFRVLPITSAITVGADLSRPAPIYRPAGNHHMAGQAPWGDSLMSNGKASVDTNLMAYLVMDYIDGSTLADYIGNTSRKKNFPPANEIVYLFASICAAIDYAHSKGIIHGDMKPANILFDTHAPHAGQAQGTAPTDRLPDTDAKIARINRQTHWSGGSMRQGAGQAQGTAPTGIPIVTDFGTTRLLGTPVGTLSRWGLVTPFYLSPKQAMGYIGDVASDIYSLGVILYEMCTGVPPFQGDSPSAIMIQHITAIPTPPIEINPALSSALSMIILRSLDKNPKMRFPNASALAAAVAEAFGMSMPDILNAPYLAPRQDSLSEGLGLTYVDLDSGLHRPDDATFARAGTRHSPYRQQRSDELMAIDVATSHGIPAFAPIADVSAPSSNSRMSTADVSATEGASRTTLTPLSPAASWERSATSSQWSPFQTPSSSGWPPPPTPPSPPAFPPAPTPSLLKLALDRLKVGRQGRHKALPLQAKEAGRQGKHKALPLPLRDSHLVLLAMLILLLIVSSVGTLLVLAHRTTSTTAQQVGYVYFLSSGQLYVNNNQGVDDEVQIDLHDIAAPHPGNSYYAWLVGDENASEAPWMLLGKVSKTGQVHGTAPTGNVHFLYRGDVAHTNLLTDMSRFVITEDKANAAPNNPFLDTSTWRYYGEIPQTPSPTDVRAGTRHSPYSMLDHIRHLLVQAPELQVLGLQGGLGTWLMQNVEEISQWALNAKEAWASKNTMLMMRQLVNILYYIDGECAPADFADMPASMPTTPENETMARIAHFSLINPCIQQQQAQANQLKQTFSHTPPDYVDHTLFHLAGVTQSPGATPALRALVISLNTAVNEVKGWLQQVRKDALQLCDMPENRLTQLSGLSVLSDLAMQARYAYAGETDPATAQVQEGVTWIYDNMQRLASIDVTAYPPE